MRFAPPKDYAKKAIGPMWRGRWFRPLPSGPYMRDYRPPSKRGQAERGRSPFQRRPTPKPQRRMGPAVAISVGI
jgi:hypothetical protein